ncbi:hypothetical protein FACS1894147_11270 [Spirochaetia bacterium]|nr:hypothetical protein FACS1894147_11270 [Spirochaetia bacterium]
MYGCDLSIKALQAIPKEINTQCCSLLNLTYPAEYFDFVYTAEALEHVINLDGALAELARVVKPDGALLIIDKDIKRSGAIKIEKWEQWFDTRKVASKLTSLGFTVTIFENVAYENKQDGLFCAWLAKKNLDHN